MIEIFYEGYAFKINSFHYCDRFFPKMTLANDRKFHFWDYDVVADTWEECLFQSLAACKVITSDYGISPPISIGEIVKIWKTECHDEMECDVDEIPF